MEGKSKREAELQKIFPDANEKLVKGEQFTPTTIRYLNVTEVFVITSRFQMQLVFGHPPSR